MSSVFSPQALRAQAFAVLLQPLACVLEATAPIIGLPSTLLPAGGPVQEGGPGVLRMSVVWGQRVLEWRLLSHVAAALLVSPALGWAG